MRIVLSLLFLLLLSSIRTRAQNSGTARGDSVLEKAKQLVNDGFRDSANIFFKRAKELFEQESDIPGIIRANNGYARSEYGLGRTNYALKLAETNLKLIDSSQGDPLEKGTCYEIMGNIFKSIGNLERGLKSFIAAEKIFADAGERGKQAGALEDIGWVEGLLGNYPRSIEYLKQALSIHIELNDKPLLAKSYYSIGSIYGAMDKIDTAAYYFTKSLTIAEEANLVGEQANALENLGGVKVVLGQFDEGIAIQKKGLMLRKQVGNYFLIAHAQMNLGSAYRDMKNYPEALRYYNDAETTARRTDGALILPKIYKYRAQVYEAMGNTTLALEEYKQFKAYDDTIQQKNKTQEIEMLRASFEMEKKEQQIAQQNTEISLLNQQERISRLQKWFLGIGLLLALGFIGFGFYGFRQRTRRIRAEKEKLDADLEFKRKELTTHALHLAKKNELLESLKEKAIESKEKESTENSSGYQQLINIINFDLLDDNNWENFARYFEEVHRDFSANAGKKYPDITSNELRLMALIKMNLSSKEIANILNISMEGIKKARQRLRKKMNLASDDSLENAIMSI